MSEEIKVGQEVYCADLRDMAGLFSIPALSVRRTEVVVLSATVAALDRALVCIECSDGRLTWTAMSGLGATWFTTRHAALMRLRREMQSGVGHAEQTLENARYELTLVEAALSAEVGDA